MAVTWLPSIVVVALAGWALLMARLARNFKHCPNPVWPFAQNPGLALELAPHQKFVEALLGEPATEIGKDNRRVAAGLQRLDFVFIPLYAAFLITAAAVIGPWPACWPAVAAVILTAAFDYWEDFRILGIIGSNPKAAPPKPIGRAKWLFFFLTLTIEGVLVFESAHGAPFYLVLAVLLAGNGIAGVISSWKTSFNGIFSSSRLSGLGMLLLAAAPLIIAAPFSWQVVAQYAVLLRVPLITGIVLLFLPALAFTKARSLLRGLFDLTPWSVFSVTLTTLAAAGSVAVAAHLVLADGCLRFGVPHLAHSPGFPVWIGIMIVLSLPITAVSVGFSARQHHELWHCLLGAAGGGALALALTVVVHEWSTSEHLSPQFLQALPRDIFRGYLESEAPGDHLLAVYGFLATLLVYIVVGFYGYAKLGRERIVPALCSALMLVTILTWILAGVAFFFDLWRIPILLIVGLAGALTAQSTRSDHFYDLRPRSRQPRPDATQTITAGQSPCIIVAAANGGGIQSAAWAAQVLYGLEQDCGALFRQSLRMISSVSGGSVGTAFYVHYLANPNEARRPDRAAVASSLDEVAWGLAWTDFLRGLLPWFFGSLIGRGRALEKAWRFNAASHPSGVSSLDRPLSSWNHQVSTGEIPAVVMNATVAETGERLLLSTTSFGAQSPAGKARVDAQELHTINGEEFDVGIATAARLSATFPYVTPASRSNGPGPQPHVVDGGYYDNYGMATLVEWLDEALTSANGAITNVLVVQILGAPTDENASERSHAKDRGWFYQAIAPLTTLYAVRTAGQIAHNEIELELLCQKWSGKNVTIESVTFEFSNPKTPLSWHLTPDEVAAIARQWKYEMESCRRRVRLFLTGT